MLVTIKKGAALLSDVPHEPFVEEQPFSILSDPAAAALTYLQYGMQPVPVSPGEKAPKVAWSNFPCTQATIPNQFAGSPNIAIRLGESSGGVVDFDLDAPEAAALAPDFLPETACVFGRESKPASHYVYRAIGPVSSLKRQAVVGGSVAVLVELRSTGSLTIFPPSVHKSGEKVRFEDGKAGIPTPVTAEDLIRQVNLLAVTTLIALVWPKSPGIRNDTAMALAGAMLRSEVSEELTKRVIVRAAAVAGDEEAAKRGEVVGNTLKKIKQGHKVTGWPRVAQLLGEIGGPVVEKCRAWLLDAGYSAAPEAIVESKVTLNTQLASEVQVKPVNWLWAGRIAYGSVCLLDGDPGMGKSSICLDIAARLSAGANLPDGTACVPARVLVLSGEDSAASTIAPRLTAAGATLNRIGLVHSVKDQNGVESNFSIPEHLPAIRAKIIETQAKLVVFDPLVAYLGKTVNPNNDQQVRQALMPLAQIAEETGVAILAVRHLNKQDGKKALYRGGGSIGIIGAARTAMVVGVDPQDATCRVLAVCKSNIGPKPLSWRYRVVGKSYIQGETKIETAAIDWSGPSGVTADELVSEVAEEQASALGSAIAFLTEVLKDGPMKVSEVQKLAKAEGIAKATLQRASKKLNVKRDQHHDGGKISGWMWSLPSQSTAPTGSNGDAQANGPQP